MMKPTIRYHNLRATVYTRSHHKTNRKFKHIVQLSTSIELPMGEKVCHVLCMIRIWWFALPIKMFCHDRELYWTPVIYFETIT
jgi:hypothetical protein